MSNIATGKIRAALNHFLRMASATQASVNARPYTLLTDAVAELDNVDKQIKEIENTRCKCWFCGGDMIWGGDHNYDEVYGEGEGVVSNLTCSVCGANAEYSIEDESSVKRLSSNLGKCAWCGYVYDTSKFCCPACQQQEYEDLD